MVGLNNKLQKMHSTYDIFVRKGNLHNFSYATANVTKLLVCATAGSMT